MVWGMMLPKGFGEYWPYGRFEWNAETRKSTWSLRLRNYYAEEMPEAQKALFDNDGGRAVVNYSSYVVRKFTSEPGADLGRYSPPYSPVEPQEPPRSFTALEDVSKLASLVAFSDMILAVDEKLKGIIEALEPGVHGFYPIEIRSWRGTIIADNYYTLLVGQYFDAFSPEASREKSWEKDEVLPDYFVIGKKKDDIVGLAFTKSVFGDAHLWRDCRLHEQLTCFSDTLKAEIDKAGLRIPKHYKMKEV